MSKFSDLLGTVGSYFKLGISGVRLKDSSGNLLVRNTGDSADAAITASQVNVSGNSVVINSDAAGSESDYQITISRPTSGMSANYTLQLPVDDGTPNQVLATDGSGVLSWASASSTASCDKIDTTSLAFGDSSPISMFTTGSSDVITKVQIVVDTAFNGSPSVSIGISGSTSKYMASTAVDLTATAGTVFEVHPGKSAQGAESLIATYSAGSASAGAARILVWYSTPS